MAKTVNDVLTNLHERARVSITSTVLFYIINNKMKEDIRDSLYSSYSTYFDKVFSFNLFKISAPAAALAGVAGSIDNGEYIYKITFVTPARETFPGLSSERIVVTDNSTDGQMSLTSIPIGTTSEVTARKVYRAQNGTNVFLLVGTISDNTTTTFTDNVSQATAVTNGEAPLGVTVPSDFYGVMGLDDGNRVSVRQQKPIDGPTPPDKRRYWLEASTITFDPDHPFNGETMQLKYRNDIDDVSNTTDSLPVPTQLQDQLLNVYVTGVSYYFLREKATTRYVQFLEGEYIAAKEQAFQGGVVRAV